MALINIPGMPQVLIGAGWNAKRDGAPAATSIILDATNEASIFIGHMVTSDGGSHTLNTTGSSSIGWQTGTSTWANTGSTLVVGVASADTSAGPPGRAANSSDVITFDVSASYTGGTGITTGSWHASVPTTGTKTIANGDLVAICHQLTARGGADVVRVVANSTEAQHLPLVTSFTGGSYAASVSTPDCIITFSDGALGYFFGTDVFSTISTRTWNSGSAQAEYGQLFQMPFGMKVSGLYGWVDPDADFDLVLYSDPLGTPVAEKTVSLDANVMVGASGRRFSILFPSPYLVRPNQPIVAAFKPGGSNISTYYKTFNDAAHRITDPYGTAGYGVQRTSGAFSDSNSSLDNYFVGLTASAFEQPATPTYMRV
jgi:hypothetical protein